MTEKLKELYQRRKAFEMYGSEVPEKLLKEIEEASTTYSLITEHFSVRR